MDKQAFSEGYMVKTAAGGRGIFGALYSVMGPAFTLITLGAVVPGLIGASGGYMFGRYGDPVSPGVMAKDLKLEQTKQIRDRLKFRKAQREYGEEALEDEQEPKEMRIT